MNAVFEKNKELMLEKAVEVAGILKLLAHEGRLKVLCFLSEGEMNVSQLCELTELSQSYVSQTLKQFEMAGLVSSRKEGKWVWYHIISDEILELIQSLQNIYCENGEWKCK